jgi:hypothetical protein
MGENEQKGNGGVPAAGDLPESSYDMERGAGHRAEDPRAEIPLRPGGPDLILDERLTSAAAPFLYLLSIILIAIAGYFLYNFLRG